jgi:hypothetical protein
MKFTPSPATPESHIALSNFPQFISLLEGKTKTIKNNKLKERSDLWEVFGCLERPRSSLRERFRQFQTIYATTNNSETRISILKTASSLTCGRVQIDCGWCSLRRPFSIGLSLHVISNRFECLKLFGIRCSAPESPVSLRRSLRSCFTGCYCFEGLFAHSTICKETVIMDDISSLQ